MTMFEDLIFHQFLTIFIVLNHIQKNYLQPRTKEVCCFAIRSISKHSAKFSQKILDTKGIKELLNCLSNEDAKVKENACSAIYTLIKYQDQFPFVQEKGVIPNLISCLNHKELSLQKMAAKTLTVICSNQDVIFSFFFFFLINF